MAYKEVLRVEIQEVIRRWQAGSSQRQIVEGTGLSRATVRKYVSAATVVGVLRDGPAPDEEQLSRLAGISRAGPREVETPVEDSLAPWADQIYQWLTGDRLTVTRIQELLEARGCTVSYTSLRRFIRKRNWGRRSVRTVRMADTEPGEVAEADFGRLGMITDPTTGRRKAVWALIIVLSYSRPCFVWPTFSQKLEDVIAGLEAARGILRRRVPLPGHRQFPRRGGGTGPPASPADQGGDFSNIPSSAVSSPIKPVRAIPRTSPRWNGPCPTSGSASSRAAISAAWRT